MSLFAGKSQTTSSAVKQQLCVSLCCSSSWEQEQSRRRRKWRAERRKESISKDESEKDSDSPESPPDSSETQEVVLAREHLVSLMTEQKKIRKQKVRDEDTFHKSGFLFMCLPSGSLHQNLKNFNAQAIFFKRTSLPVH